MLAVETCGGRLAEARNGNTIPHGQVMAEVRGKVEWTRKIRAALNEIFDYLLKDNPQAAVDVLDQIEQSVTHLASRPGIERPGRV